MCDRRITVSCCITMNTTESTDIADSTLAISLILILPFFVFLIPTGFIMICFSMHGGYAWIFRKGPPPVNSNNEEDDQYTNINMCAAWCKTRLTLCRRGLQRHP